MKLAEIRHTLHRLAEPSGCEVQTKTYIMQQLKTLQPAAVHTFDNSRNILAVYDSGQAGRTLLFRGDFDAVRVDETIEVPYASQTPGVSHKCGHDGHATILLGLAAKLNAQPLRSGRVLLLFQAAEETGHGAQQLLDTGILEQYSPDEVYALHNIPGEPMGTVICRPESFTCSVISCDIELHGHTAHASEPLKALCPYPMAKRITDKLLSFNQYDIEREDFCLLTLVEFRIGEQAYGVAAGHGVIRFTLRAKNDEVLQQMKLQLLQTVDAEVNCQTGLTYYVTWKEYFAASKNQPSAVGKVQRAAEACGLNYMHKKAPFSWGEDFGLLTQHYNGALFGVGSGEQQPALHHQHFDFPDELLEIGAQLFYTIAMNA